MWSAAFGTGCGKPGHRTQTLVRAPLFTDFQQGGNSA